MYFDNLWRMLKPLGVYGEQGYHVGELKAMGVELDGAQEELDSRAAELQIETAVKQGLTDAEALFPMLTGSTMDGRRTALEVLFGVDGRSCSRSGLEETLEACGIPVTISETRETFYCLVTMRNVLTLGNDPVFQARVLEALLPCHLDIEVAFAYRNQQTGSAVGGQLGLDELRSRSQAEWEQLMGYGT